MNKANYMPFISERYESANDILEIVDRNERNFKSVAEQMIYNSSQLDMPKLG